MAIRIASLFTGVGGFELGAEAAFGKENVEHVAFVEYDKFCSEVLAYRWPGVPNYGDVTKVDWEKFPKVDLLHASPSCQAFSVAGKQQGMDDEQGRGKPIWDAYFKCLEVVRPPVFTMEEVPALLSKKFEKEWAWICSEWERLGYHVKFTKIQALDHGVPQSRNRLIAVGFLDKAKCDAFEWPAPQPRTKKLKDILQPEHEVDVKYYLKAEQVIKLLGKMTDEQIGNLMSIGNPKVAQFVGDRDNPSVSVKDEANTIPANPMSDRGQVVINPFTAVQQDAARTIRTGGSSSLDDKHNHDTIGVVVNRGVIVPQEEGHANCIDASYHKNFDNHAQRTGIAVINKGASQDYRLYSTEGVSPTLASNRGGGSAKSPYILVESQDGKPWVLIGDKALAIRRLTPVEVERLQSFPDD